jgi:hypothetical protein
MLRASVEAKNGEVDLRAITEGARDDSVGVAYAAELTAFAEACIRGDASALVLARDALRAKAGAAALVDAAGVIGNFERMTRIADATGIPLDAPSALASSDFRSRQLERFASAQNTPRAGIVQRLIAPLFAPAAKRMLARLLTRQ